MIRCLSLLFGLGLFAALSAQARAQTAVPGMTISGGDLPHPVRLAGADADAFTRRINTPPRLETRPAGATGRVYTLTSDYWIAILSRPDRPEVSAQAIYYPQGGIVRARIGSEDAWLALDLRQQAILARYIALAKGDALTERPGIVGVLTATAVGEDVTLVAGGSPLSGAQARPIWEALGTLAAPQFFDSPQAPTAGASGVWLVFGLQEGRSLQLLYEAGSPASLRDALGYERYDVTPALASAMSSVRQSSRDINDETEPGSYAWWVVLFGGGIVCLAVAVWLARHSWRLPFQPRS